MKLRAVKVNQSGRSGFQGTSSSLAAVEVFACDHSQEF